LSSAFAGSARVAAVRAVAMIRPPMTSTVECMPDMIRVWLSSNARVTSSWKRSGTAYAKARPARWKALVWPLGNPPSSSGFSERCRSSCGATTTSESYTG
jgi:hypothetical protein